MSRLVPSVARHLLAGAALLLLLLVVAGVVVLARQGYGLYIVHTGSMDPTYSSGDLIVERSGLSYGPGDVITFEHGAGPQDLVTHRITDVTSAGISTKGDGNPAADVWSIRPDQVHGTAVAGLRNAGYVAYFLKQPAGVGSVMTGLLSLILLWRIFFPDESSEEVHEPEELEFPQDEGPATTSAADPPSASVVSVPKQRVSQDQLVESSHDL